VHIWGFRDAHAEDATSHSSFALEYPSEPHYLDHENFDEETDGHFLETHGPEGGFLLTYGRILNGAAR
jgi:hypothetical protein